MPTHQKKLNHKFFVVLALLFCGMALCVALNAPAQAQSSYQNLILSDDYDQHYLSPYLLKYPESTQSTGAYDILTNKNLKREVLNNTGSILLFKINDETTWFSFDVINRSTHQNWSIELGDQYDGKFGFFDAITVYDFDRSTSKLRKKYFEHSNTLNLKLPPNKKIKIILEFKKAKGTPVTTPLLLKKSSVIPPKKLINMKTIITFFLVGMAFSFAAIALVKYNFDYLFITAYYVALLIFSYVQNSFSLLNTPFAGGELKAYIFFAVAFIALLTAHLFWSEDKHRIWLKPTLIFPIGFGIISLILSQIVHDPNHLSNFFLLYGPSLIIFLSIPLAYLLQGSSRTDTSAPFMLGWLFFLFGIFITIFALSGFLQPSSSTINAYWFSLIPQALCFLMMARISSNIPSQNLFFSKTLEIDENESISEIIESKESTEQGRLLKVIEQERKVLTELRKSEVRQKEDMRKAKEIADEANKGKSAFLAVVSHEIRTPMTGIMGMVRMLLDSNLTREQNEYAQTIQDSSDAMLALLNDILDFEKIEQGKMTFENISFDLRRLIQGVSTLMQGHAKQKNIELILNVGKNLPDYVTGDPTRLRQVLLNLTGNAIKFTEKGSVTITAELMKENKGENESEIYFSIIDNGIGISEEAKKNLFTPFSQANKSISRKFGGTGLGLAISKGLIETMGSEINISSIENEGSTFFFTLTMKHGLKDNVKAEKSILNTHKKDNITKKTILLVDDNNINRKVVKSLLSELPYAIHSSETAEDALEKVKTQNFDLILMDIELPEMNGDEAARQIRLFKDQKIRNIPIIALTGNTDTEQIQHYYNCGMNCALSKPIDPLALTSTIENVSKGIFDSTPDFNKIQSESFNQKPSPSLISSGTPNDVPDKSEIQPITDHIKIEKSVPVPESMTPVTSTSETNTNLNQVLNEETINSLTSHLSTNNILEMTNEVLEKTLEIIQDLEAAYKTGNMEEIKAKSHDLKGMTGNFGFTEIESIAKDLEVKCKTQPLLVLSALIAKLPDAKKRAETALLDWSLKQDNI
jgi:signal transduction histidine kinase/CheY-like chemotaxis protein/HPt (histidine-containing phosphotransfer) domain-containing protein